MLGLGISLARGAFASIITYVKDGLKLFYNFTEHQDNPISHASAGSTSFDGTDDYISIADADNLSFGDGSTDSAFSISAWVKMDDATNFTILNKGVYNTDAEWNFRTNASDKLVLALYDESVSSTHESIVSDSAITTHEGSWIHIVGTYNGVGGASANGGLKLYLNGISLDSTASDAGTYVAMENLAGDVYIGKMDSNYADGSIANVGIWSRALSASEVQGIMYKQYSDLGSVEKTNLVSWWGLDEDYTDSHGSNDGTNSGSTLTNSVYGDNAPKIPRILDVATPKQAVQLADGSTSFDGSDDYVDCGADSSLDNIFDGGGTISAWIYTLSLGGNNAGRIFDTMDTDGWALYVLDESSGAVKIKLHQDFSTTNGKWTTTASEVILNEWTHIACVYNSDSVSNTPTIYINGSSVTLTISSTPVGTRDSDSGGNKRIGDRSLGGRTFDGSLANVSIHSSALTQSQVQELMFTEKYAGLSADLKTNLVSWYDMGDTSLGSEMVTGTDSDFTGAGNWSTVNAVATPNYDSGDEGHSSTMRIEANDGTNDRAELAVAQWDDSPVIGGQYQVSVEYKYINNDGSPTTKLSMLGVNKSLDSSNTEWTSYTDTIVAVDDSTQFRFYVSQTGGTADNEVLIDNLSIRPYVVEDLEGSNDGTIVGATTTTGYTSSPHGVVDPINYGTLKSGTALSFDGTNDYVDTGDTFQSTFDGSFSISAWVTKPTSTSYLLGSVETANSDVVYVYLYNTGKVKFKYVSNGNSASAISDISVFNGDFSFITMVADSTIGGVGGLQIYADGKEVNLDAGDTGNTSGIVFADYVNSRTLPFGCRNDAGAYNGFCDTKISNVKIFDVALTESEIQEQFLNPEQILPTGVSSSNLKLWLPLQEGSGTTNYDGSGNNNDGTITGATWDTANTDIAQVGLVRQNKPMVFDGSDDYVAIDGVISSVSSDTAGTISCWVNPTDATPSAYELFFALSDTNAQTRLSIGIEGTSGVFRAYCYTGGVQQWYFDTDSNPFTDGVWTHVAITHNGTAPVLYVNGAVPAQTFNTSADKTVWINGISGLDNVRIGCRNKNSEGNTNFFDGLINEVAIWDEALTATEITALYNSGTPLDATTDSGNYASSDGLQGYWRNDGDTTWTDRSTNSNDGTVSGSPDSIVLTEGLTSGRDSQGFYLTDTTENCLTLNGAEYVEVDSILTTIGTDTSGTVEMWVRPDDGQPASAGLIFAMGDTNANETFSIYNRTNGTLQFYLTDAGTAQWDLRSSSAVWADGESTWKHIVLTQNGTEPVLYVNGSAVTQSFTTSTDKTVWLSDLSGLDNIRIGCRNYNSGGNTSFFSGKIDDVRIYSQALSSDEVTKNYNAGKSKHS